MLLLPVRLEGTSQELFGIQVSVPGRWQGQPGEWGLLPAHCSPHSLTQLCWTLSAHPPKPLGNEVIQGSLMTFQNRESPQCFCLLVISPDTFKVVAPVPLSPIELIMTPWWLLSPCPH